jgi:hypothetical protein
MNLPRNETSLRVRQAESRDAPSILELYRQLVRPVARMLKLTYAEIVSKKSGLILTIFFGYWNVMKV